ncbi:transferase family-domain-containing protein [Diplogelasinospora grovesii]|uniref:Transferase family-domain-containing protein n=1 Tax=Diplogelasinospora grovesii TaxID=303347 RepID=A0AAN6N338_9PEZI|nr:transferase family-domain-containing protein [Diplogelasinospora grovesii]
MTENIDTSPPCRVRSTRRVFPATATKQTTITKLSILDASVARFAPCAAIWLYDASQGVDSRNPILFELLGQALRQTLDLYPHYAGQLQWATEDLVKGDVNSRHLGRPVVAYGAAEDPGVELVIAEDRRDFGTIVPNLQDRATTKKIWNATDFPQDDLLPKAKLAFSNLANYKGLPGVAVQLTAFRCGGFAVGVKLTHCLSDATCLLHVVRLWADRSRQLSQSGQAALPSHSHARPLFDPAQLDRHAGLTGAPEADADKTSKARALPMHRFDWWATDAPGYPEWATASSNATKPHPQELSALRLSPSTSPPWPTWDLAAPVEHVQIYFRADEITRMKQAAEGSLPEALRGQRVSRLDAILAHLWILINRARQLDGSRDPVYMDITLGLRGRVEPPLPDSFVGSPLLLAYVAKAGSEVSSATTIGSIAGSIRQTLSRFTPDAVSAYIHDAAYEVSPQRLWQGFLGSRHTMVTSWTRARTYEVDFCPGQGLARYVQAYMPRMDGLLQIGDLADTGGFDVSLCLERESLARLLQDPMLREFEN